MIQETFIPKSKTNDAFFRYDVPFHGDIKKTYSCVVVGSNAPTPKIMGFTTKTVDGVSQNHIILEIEARCNNVQMTVNFNTEAEMVEKKKVEFLTWFSRFFTWFDFLFRYFSLSALKKITKVITIGFAIPVILGFVYAGIEYSYESIYDENFEDSEIVEVWSNFTIPEIAKWLREDGADKAGDLGVFLKEKSEDAKDKAGDMLETAKDKAEDLKEAAQDKYEELTD